MYVAPSPSLQTSCAMNIEQARENMIKQQLITWDVADDQVLTLFYQLPREAFIPQVYQSLAFTDIGLPLPFGQKTLSPKEEARILQSLAVKPTEKCLVLGTQNGYITALLAKLAHEVYSIDDSEVFTHEAQHRLQQLAIHNVTFITAPAALGWQQAAPFDVVVVTGSLPTLPTSFRQLLAPQGRLFVILGKPPVMEATLITHLPHSTWRVEKLYETRHPRLPGYEEPPTFTF